MASYPKIVVACWALLLMVLSACSSSAQPELVDPPPAQEQDAGDEIDPDQEFPNVVEVDAERVGTGPMNFLVTISSPYDTPERYADAWRVVDANTGEVLGVRELAHDHQNEQPFARSLNGVEVGDQVTDLLFEARDSENGWGGQTMQISIAPVAPLN